MSVNIRLKRSLECDLFNNRFTGLAGHPSTIALKLTYQSLILEF